MLRDDHNQIYLKHHWGGGKAVLGVWPDRTRTLVSMATDSSHNGKNLVSTLAPSFLQVRRTTTKSRMSSKIGPIRPRTAE